LRQPRIAGGHDLTDLAHVEKGRFLPGHPDLGQLQNARGHRVAFSRRPPEEGPQRSVNAAQRLRLNMAAAKAWPGPQLGAVPAHNEDLQVLEAPDLSVMLTQPAEEAANGVLVEP